LWSQNKCDHKTDICDHKKRDHKNVITKLKVLEFVITKLDLSHKTPKTYSKPF